VSRTLWALLLVGCLGAGVLTGAVFVVLEAWGIHEASWWEGAVIGTGLALVNGCLVVMGQRRRRPRHVRRGQ
jgi:hypothetical protein